MEPTTREFKALSGDDIEPVIYDEEIESDFDETDMGGESGE